MRITWVVIVFGLTLLTACRQPDANPELRDPIYADMFNKPDAYATKAKEQKEKIADLKKDLSKMEPRDPARKRTQKEIYDLERGLVAIEQEAKYYEIRLEQRRKYARKAYMEAFNAGKDWPEPAEFEEYQKRKRLRETPRSWEARRLAIPSSRTAGCGSASIITTRSRMPACWPALPRAMGSRSRSLRARRTGSRGCGTTRRSRPASTACSR